MTEIGRCYASPIGTQLAKQQCVEGSILHMRIFRRTGCPLPRYGFPGIDRNDSTNKPTVHPPRLRPGSSRLEAETHTRHRHYFGSTGLMHTSKRAPEQANFMPAAVELRAQRTQLAHVDVDRVAFDLSPSKTPASLQDGARVGTVIVGAGPAGLLTACLLAKTGMQVAVFEKRDRPTEVAGSFPVVLNTRGLQALSRLGPDVVARFRAEGRNVEQLHVVPRNKTVSVVDTAGICIMRDQVVWLLLEIADQLGVPIHWGHKLADLDPQAQTCTFQRQRNASTQHAGPGLAAETGMETLTLNVLHQLVGADGNFSRVRRTCETKTGLQVETMDWGAQMRFLKAPDPVGTTNPPEVNGAVHYILGGDGYVCQQPNSEWSISLPIVPGRSAPWLLDSEATPANVEQLRALCEERATPFARHLLSPEVYTAFFRGQVFDGQLVKCASLAPTEWIALVGDAGHAVAPYSGEGINSALESAQILAQVLGRGGSCAQFDEQRREDAHANFELALKTRTMLTGSARHKFASAFATVVLGIGKKLGWVHGTVQDYMLGSKAAAGVWRYKDLLGLDRSQRWGLHAIGGCLFYACCGCCGRCSRT